MVRTLVLMIAGLALPGLALTACSADPDAPVNQSFPIRQMDSFFHSLSGPPARADYTDRSQPTPPVSPDYTHEPGYAPAYPPYQ